MKEYKIVFSETEPGQNCIWLKKDGSLNWFMNGKWIVINTVPEK